MTSATDTPLADRTDFGARLRGLRKARGLTLSELAQRIGKTAGFLSQIERGNANPSVPTIEALTKVLDVPGQWFAVGDTDELASDSGLIVRKNNRRRLRYGPAVKGAHGFTDDLISPHLSGEMFGYFTTFAPGATWGSYDPSREHEVLIYLLSGMLLIEHDGESHTLKSGDSIQYKLYPGIKNHKVRNASSEHEATVLAVTSPVVLDT